MKVTIKPRNNGIIEIAYEEKGSYIRLQQINPDLYCVITTFVDANQRGKGLGEKLYLEMIKFIRENKAKFKATCPFVVAKANQDKSIKDIYLV
jgi:predicted GNAT family acetyltransferase